MSREAAVVPRERESSRWLAGVERYGATIAVAAVSFWLAYDGGSFGLTTRNTVSIAVWWLVIVALALGLWPAAPMTRAAAVTALLLTSLAAFTLASTVWAAGQEAAFAEFDRTLLYVGIFLIAVLAWRGGDAVRVADGLALGIAATGLVALGSRCYPHVFGTDDALQFLPSAQHRLSYPVDYWNGLAILLGIGFPLLLRAASSSDVLAMRAVALAPLPALAGAIYLTSSRGGVATALLGTIAFVLLTDRRIVALTSIVIAGGGSVVVVALLHARPELVNDPGTTAAAAQGRTAGVLIALVCVVTGAVQLGVAATARRVHAPGRRAEQAVAVGLVALIAVGIAVSHPVRRFEAFKVPPPTLAQAPTQVSNPTQAHLLSGGGTGRWQEWTAAIDQWKTRPLVGRGAGSFESWWAEHGTVQGFIADAHSLYAEALGELGIVGLALIAGAFGTGLATGLVRLRRADAATRPTLAAITAAFVAYLLGAGIDWMWEMTIVSIVGITLLGLLTGPATLAPSPRAERAESRIVRRLAIGATILVGAGALYAEAVPVLSDMRLRASQSAATRGDLKAALSRATDARNFEPWSSSPYLQVALVQEQAGNFAAAHRAIGQALERDRKDWRLWLVLTRIQTKQGRYAAAARTLRHAASLNPRSTLFASLPSA